MIIIKQGKTTHIFRVNVCECILELWKIMQWF